MVCRKLCSPVRDPGLNLNEILFGPSRGWEWARGPQSVLCEYTWGTLNLTACRNPRFLHIHTCGHLCRIYQCSWQLHFHRKEQKLVKLKISMTWDCICKLRAELWFIIYYFQWNVFPSLQSISKPRIFVRGTTLIRLRTSIPWNTKVPCQFRISVEFLVWATQTVCFFPDVVTSARKTTFAATCKWKSIAFQSSFGLGLAVV